MWKNLPKVKVLVRSRARTSPSPCSVHYAVLLTDRGRHDMKSYAYKMRVCALMGTGPSAVNPATDPG